MMRYLVFAVIVIGNVQCADNEWTWQYKKLFSAADCKQNGNKSVLQFAKIDVPNFSQLIFSWNALRPTSGHFTFFGQVRDAKTKKWHGWHKMLEWGAAVQRSFFSKDSTTYHHVRLEIPTDKLADALRIKVVSEGNASLSSLHALFVSISDHTKFIAETVHDYTHLRSIEIQNIPQQSQMVLTHPKKEVLCSPTSCSMVLSYLTGKPVDPALFADRCYDTGLCAYGSWPYNVAHAYEYCNAAFFFTVARLSSFKSLHSYLLKNIPVIVSVRGKITNAPQEYNQGHLLVVVGWDQAKNKIICNDPAFGTNEQTRVAYDAASFLQAWERSRRLAYLIQIAK